MKLTRLTITAMLCLGPAALAQENAETLKQRILAQAQSTSPDEYAFTRTVRTNVVAGGNTEQTVNVETYDPTKPPGSRWSLVSVNGAAPSAEALKKFRKEVPKRRVLGYHRLANYFASQATVAKEGEGRTVFHFATLPKDTVVIMRSDLSHRATAEVAINTDSREPFAEQVRVNVKPTRLMLMMRLSNYDSISRFQLGEDGKPVLAEQTLEMAGTGMGLDGRMRSVATYSDFRAVRGER